MMTSENEKGRGGEAQAKHPTRYLAPASVASAIELIRITADQALGGLTLSGLPVLEDVGPNTEPGDEKRARALFRILEVCDGWQKTLPINPWTAREVSVVHNPDS